MIVTCKQLVERVTDHREKTLSAVDRAGWALHLAWCRNCREYARQIDATVETLRTLADGDDVGGVRVATERKL